MVACMGVFFLNLVSFSTLLSKWYVRRSNFFAILVRAIIPVLGVALLCLTEAVVFDGRFSILQNIITIVTSSAVAFFGAATVRRSKYGNKVLEEILGYREFIDKVEVDKLKMMIKDDPDLYYRVLSYAIVLGLEDKWARKFDGMIVNPPVWYTGYSTFDVYYMTASSRTWTRTMHVPSFRAWILRAHSSSWFQKAEPLRRPSPTATWSSR